MTDATAPGHGAFHDLADFVAQRRATGLVLSDDGTRLVAALTELNRKGNDYVTALWELPHGKIAADSDRAARPRRLTRGVDGEALVGFTPGNDLLFTAKRDLGDDDDSDETRLFLLPRDGGEAFVAAHRHGGYESLRVARTSGRLAVVSAVHPSAADEGEDRALAAARRTTKTSAILHTGHPVRYWDHDLGPARDQILVAEPIDAADPDAELTLRRISSFGPAERLGGIEIAPDGETVYADLTRTLHGTTARSEIVAVDVATGAARTLAALDGYDLELAALAPDGTFALVERSTIATADRPLASDLARLELATGNLTDVFRDFTDWPGTVRISPDGEAAYFTADRHGHGAVLRLDLATGDVTAITDDRRHYDALALDPRDGSLVALADAIDAPPLPVSIDASSGAVTPIPCGLVAPEIPGTLTEVTTTAEDGTPLRAWLCLPESLVSGAVSDPIDDQTGQARETAANDETEGATGIGGAGASPGAPLLLWIHGGPMSTWNAWTWRWNPWTATARGYAVLLPDPAISTGYGQHMIDRGWGQLGGTPYDDIMRLTRAALERDDIDETRKAALGGSYGGYMANWIAGRTGTFFDCVVTHASLWSLDQFRATTDTAAYWSANLTDAHNARYDPAAGVEAIETPMLVVHGDKDYRVPIGEGLRLWYELLTAADQDPADNPHRFLLFPDENHWILSPNNSRIWYETVFAFVDHHVRGDAVELPRLLG